MPMNAFSGAIDRQLRMLGFAYDKSARPVATVSQGLVSISRLGNHYIAHSQRFQVERAQE